MTGKTRLPNGKSGLWHLSGQCQMEAKILHYIRIPPSHQQRVLPRAQPNLAPLGKLGRAGRRAKPVKLADTGCSKPLQGRRITRWRQGQKAVQNRQFQPLAGDRRKLPRKRGCCSLQALACLPCGQAEGRLQRSVQPVFARCRCDIRQIGQVELAGHAPTRDVPPQPGSPKIRQWPGRRQIVNRKSSVRHKRCFSRVLFGPASATVCRVVFGLPTHGDCGIVQAKVPRCRCGTMP